MRNLILIDHNNYLNNFTHRFATNSIYEKGDQDVTESLQNDDR